MTIASFIRRWGHALVMLLGAALLLAGLGSPGLWEPWEMDRAFLATSLDAPAEVVAALQHDDDALLAATSAAVTAEGAVLRRPDAATAASDPTAHVRMAIDMARHRAVAALILDLRLFPPGAAKGPAAASDEAGGRLLLDAMKAAGRAPVVLLGADAADRREALLLAANRLGWKDRADTWGLSHLTPEDDPDALDAALARQLASDPDAQRVVAVAGAEAAGGLAPAVSTGVAAIAGIVQFRDDGAIATFPPLETWLRAASFAVLGPTEFAARLPGVLLSLAALAVLLGALAVAWSSRVALLAGLAVMTMPLFLDQGRIVVGEPGLMLGLTLAACSRLLAARDGAPSAGLARFLPAVYLALGFLFAFLSKGLFGAFVVTAVILVEPAVRGARDLRSWLPVLLVAAASGLLAAVVIGAEPGTFASQFGLRQALFSEGPTPYFRSFDLIIKTLGFGLTPWSPIAVVAIGLITFGAFTEKDRRGLIVAAWFFIPVVALMMTLKDFNHFVFAAAPAAAVAIGVFADRIASRGFHNGFVAIALLFMYFILRNELKQSPEPLIAALTYDPPFSKDGQLRFPEGLSLGFAFKTMLALAAAFCLLHIGRLGQILPRAAAFLARPRPFAISLAAVGVLFAIAVLSLAGRPHGRAMSSNYADIVGPTQKEFVRTLASFAEPMMLVGIAGVVLLAGLAFVRFYWRIAPEPYFQRRPRLAVLGWGVALAAWGAVAAALVFSTDVPADFWGETLASTRALPGWAAAALVSGGIFFLSRRKDEAIVAGLAVVALMLATRFIRDTGASHPLLYVGLLIGALKAVASFGMRILGTPERFALGAGAFVMLILFGFTAPLLDRWSWLGVLMAQGGPVTSPLSLVVSGVPIVLALFAVALVINARGRELLARLRITPGGLERLLDAAQRGPVLVGALVVIAFVVTGLNVFRFQPSFAINVSQKHIIDTWREAAGAGESGGAPEDRIARHGSFGQAGSRDTNFYTAGFPELRDRQSALRVLLGKEDVVTAVETRDGTEYRLFPAFSEKNDANGDGVRDAEVLRGRATEVGPGRLVDRTQSWAPGALKGRILLDAFGGSWVIADNDATSLTVETAGRWTFALRPAERAFFAVTAGRLPEPSATARARERRALLIPADSLSDINHAWRQVSGGEHLPVLEGSSYRVLLATSWLAEGEAQQNRLANATYKDETFRALEKPHLHRVWGSFEDTIQVVGWDVDKPLVGGNDKLRLTVYYKSLKPLRKSMKIFMHLDKVGASNRIHGDHWPLNPTRHSEDNKNCTGCFRTDHWMPGDIVADTYDIEIPEGSSAGDYMIWLGFYQPGPDTRLKLTSWDQKNCKHDGANRLGIGTITVK